MNQVNHFSRQVFYQLGTKIFENKELGKLPVNRIKRALRNNYPEFHVFNLIDEGLEDEKSE